MMTSMLAPLPKLRWYQFSLRSLLLFVALCAIPCSWVAVKRERVRRQQEMIEKLGGAVAYVDVFSLPGIPEEYDFAGLGNRVTDADLERLIPVLSRVTHLDLSDTQITDAGLQHLTGLIQLQYLYLKRTKVTDEGVKKLQQALPNCQIAH